MRPLPLILLLLARPALAADPSPAPATPPATPADALPPASGPTPAPSTAAADALPPPPSAETPPPRFGLRLGLGAPDGVTADLVYRLLPYLRLQAGPAWNYLAFGLQGGIAITPVRWAVSPVLELRYGHFFGADLSKVFTNAPTELQPLLSDVGYDYFNGQVAMELGSPRGFSFSLGVGLSYFWSDLHGTATTDRNPGTPDAATVTVTNPKLRAVIPSVRLGLLFYF